MFWPVGRHREPPKQCEVLFFPPALVFPRPPLCLNPPNDALKKKGWEQGFEGHSPEVPIEPINGEAARSPPSQRELVPKPNPQPSETQPGRRAQDVLPGLKTNRSQSAEVMDVDIFACFPVPMFLKYFYRTRF